MSDTEDSFKEAESSNSDEDFDLNSTFVRNVQSKLSRSNMGKKTPVKTDPAGTKVEVTTQQVVGANALQGGGGGPGGPPLVGGSPKGVLGNQARASVTTKFPNPLTPDFEPDLEGLEEINLEIPDEIANDTSDEGVREARRFAKVIELQKCRTKLYGNITRMKNTFWKVWKNQTDMDEWQRIHDRIKEAEVQVSTLNSEIIKLGESLNKYERGQMSKYLTIATTLRTNIECLMDAASGPIPDLASDMIEDFVKEEKVVRKAASPEGRALKRLEEKVAQLELDKNNYLSSTLRDPDDPPDPPGVRSKKKEPDYRGLDKLELIKFSGNESGYQRFKVSFISAHENRELGNKWLALKLEKSLTDRPLELVQKYLSAGLNDSTYKEMWDLLDSRFGGAAVEDAYIVAEFKKAGVLKSNSLKELERMFDVFNIQSNYYQKSDADSLKSETSFITQMAREKLNYKHSTEFVKFILLKGKKNCFASILEWLEQKFKVAQITERQFCQASTSKFSSSANHLYEEGEVSGSEAETEGADEGSLLDKLESQTFFTQDGAGKFKPVNFRKFASKSLGNRKPGFASANKFPSKVMNGCPVCKVPHDLTVCQKFKNMSIKERYFILFRDKICFHCLLGSHAAKDCKTKDGKLCGVSDCPRYHHPLLHRDPREGNFIEDDMRELTPAEIEAGSILHVSAPGTISIQTLVCEISGFDVQRSKTVALIDTGSNVTCIDASFAKERNFPIRAVQKDRIVHLVDRVVKVEGESYLVEFMISAVDDLVRQTLHAWTVPDLAAKTGVVDWSERKKDFPHLKDVDFPSLPENPQIQILIGIDYPHLFVPKKVVANKARPLDPVAFRTPLGWTCIGRSKQPWCPKENKMEVVSYTDITSLALYEKVLFDEPESAKFLGKID